MRDILNLPQIERSKLEDVKRLIDDIAENLGDCSEKLKALGHITGKEHDAMEFAEYWGWTDLDVLAQITLMPEPPCLRDLTMEEVTELVTIVKESIEVGEDTKVEYYKELLHRSLSLSDVLRYIMSEGSAEDIAGKMMQAAKSSVIIL